MTPHAMPKRAELRHDNGPFMSFAPKDAVLPNVTL
jgi:hypothetical protein